MLRPPVPLLLLLIPGACASVEWQAAAPELPSSWRHCQLFVSESVYVLARDESAAAEIHTAATRARAAISAQLGRDPGRGLVIALSADDPLPVPEPRDYVDAIAAWFERFTGEPPPSREDPEPLTFGDKKLELDPALLLRLLAVPVPGDDVRLELPRRLVDAANFVLVLPTDTCLDRSAAGVVENARRAAGIGAAALWAASLVSQAPAALLRDNFAEQNNELLYEVWLRGLEIPRSDVHDLLVAMKVRRQRSVSGVIRRDAP